MKFNRMRVALCAFFLIANTQECFATILAKGNNNAADVNETFLSTVLAKVYDHPTSFLFLTTDTLPDSNVFALARASRTFGVPRPTFKGIMPEGIQGRAIAVLTLATSRGNTDPNLAFAFKPTDPSDLEKIVNILTNNGTLYHASEPLRDATNPPDVDGAETKGVTSIAANQSFIFAALIPTTSSADLYGELDSGIGVVAITPNSLVLNQVPAVAGDSGVKAKILDATTPALLISGSITSINPNNRPQLDDNPFTYPLMVWDDILQRLYIGFDIEISDTYYGDSGARSVAVARASTSGILEFSAIAPDAAFLPGFTDNIIGVRSDSCYYPPCNANLAINHLATLHASTGPSYLIVNGGNGIQDEIGNKIFALPLVDNPAIPATHGTLANKNSALVNGKFITPALTNPDLVADSDAAALVGAGDFPFAPDNKLSDFVVIGDTVYASSKEPQYFTEEIGIFYSQAMFDETGKIIRWTPWTKRSFPYEGFPGNSPQVSFFDVDAGTGEIWAVGGRDNTVVRVSTWNRGTSPVSLVTQLNKVLACTGSFSVLDLDQSTRGFLNNTCSRYALFGGVNQVIFTQVSKAFSATSYCDLITNPQAVMTDYASTENLLVTSLPECGAVTVLEYSRRGDTVASELPANYFYAGTQRGLFVFAGQLGNAIDVTQFGNLNLSPFSNGKWHHATAIKGTVVDIKTTGNMLYVLTLNSTPSAPLQGTVYRIPFQPTVSAMFNPSNLTIIAQTRTAPTFDSILRFLGMQIISTQIDGSTEQLVLATNRGLFKSSRAGGVQGATSQTNAGWQLISDGGNNFYVGIGGMHSSIPIAPPSTVWPFNLQDPTNLRLFNRGSINQLNGTADAGPFSFAPPFFNSIETTNPNFATLDPITYFWSDGARRFFIVNPSSQKCPSACGFNKLMTLPFDTIDWDVANPQEQIDFDATLTGVQSFNWVEDIGATGIIIAGTNKGVVGLE